MNKINLDELDKIKKHLDSQGVIHSYQKEDDNLTEVRIKYLHDKFMRGEEFSQKEKMECFYFIIMLEPIIDSLKKNRIWDLPRVVKLASRSITIASAFIMSLCILKLFQW